MTNTIQEETVSVEEMVDWLQRRVPVAEPVYARVPEAILAHIAAQAAEIERKDAVLKSCADKFSFYASQHREKSPPDILKAATNAEMAEFARAAITKGGKL